MPQVLEMAGGPAVRLAGRVELRGGAAKAPFEGRQGPCWPSLVQPMTWSVASFMSVTKTRGMRGGPSGLSLFVALPAAMMATRLPSAETAMSAGTTMPAMAGPVCGSLPGCDDRDGRLHDGVALAVAEGAGRSRPPSA